jgi:hypothetical protein
VYEVSNSHGRCWLEHHLIPRLASSGLVQLNVVCHCLTKFPTVLTVLLTRGTLKIRPCKIARISLCLEKPRASLLLGWPVPLSLSLYLSQRGRTQRCPRALSASRRRPQKSTTTKTNLSSPHQPHFAHSRLRKLRPPRKRLSINIPSPSTNSSIVRRVTHACRSDLPATIALGLRGRAASGIASLSTSSTPELECSLRENGRKYTSRPDHCATLYRESNAHSSQSPGPPEYFTVKS